MTQETIMETDWKATRMAWEEEDKMIAGHNTFSRTHTWTFKIKLIHQHLPITSQKR